MQNIKNIILGFIFVVFLSAIIASCANGKCKPRKQIPRSVPENAYWTGECDGGYWIYLLSDSSNYYHFRIYNGYDGVLMMDALFTTTDSCNLTKSNWKDAGLMYNKSFDNDTLVCINYHQGDKWITLHAVYPAYGGDTWNVIKEKYSVP